MALQLLCSWGYINRMTNKNADMKVSEETRKELNIIKASLDNLKSHDDTIKFLIKYYKENNE